jgi:hypothetical protein
MRYEILNFLQEYANDRLYIDDWLIILSCLVSHLFRVVL